MAITKKNTKNIGHCPKTQRTMLRNQKTCAMRWTLLVEKKNEDQFQDHPEYALVKPRFNWMISCCCHVNKKGVELGAAC